jgi:D-alanine--poly(phosphoribitol) ligase subunit 1
MIAKEELNILWSLEQTAKKYEDRVAVSDVNQELTWKGLVKKAQVIGAELSKKVQPGNPIPVLLEKSSETLAVMLGIVYAGCFYVPVNPMNPAERLRKIMEKLEPEVIISDEKGKEQNAEGIYEDRHINEEPVNSQEIFFQDAYEACNK